MASELDSFTFFGDQAATWEAPADDSFCNVSSFPLDDFEAIEDHLFNLETDPILPSDSSFFMDLYNYQPIPMTCLEPDSMIEPAPMIVEPDVCDTFLNDCDLGPISPIESPNCINEIFNNSTTLNVSNTSDVDAIQPNNTTDVATPNPGRQDDNEDDDEEEEAEAEVEAEPKRGTLNCKNLVSERNRRKRLSQQLLALRALVPNITKMDKRSVLVDALAYVKNLHEETARLQKEVKEQQQHPRLSDLRGSNQDNPSGSLRVPRAPAKPKPKVQITEIDTEKIEEKRFVVKITCKGAGSFGGDILRVFESLDFEITYTSLQQLKPQELLVTVFIRVRKQGKMTEEKLKDSITSMALRSGITLQNP